MKKIGTYQLGWRWVDLYLDNNGEGASFEIMPDNPKKSGAKIVIGNAGQDVAECWKTLCHEAMELALTDCMARFRHDEAFSRASDMYYFFCHHNQFTEATAMLGSFLLDCHKDFNKSIGHR